MYSYLVPQEMSSDHSVKSCAWLYNQNQTFSIVRSEDKENAKTEDPKKKSGENLLNTEYYLR